MWQWKVFFFYLGAIALLLVVLPALLAGDGTKTHSTGEKDWPAAPLPPTGGENLLLQVYVVEHGEMVEMDLEVYIAGVVAAEMPASFHEEAFKAQAVASRTYALQKALLLGGRGCSRRPGADLCTDSTCCQAWDRGAAQAMFSSGGMDGVATTGFYTEEEAITAATISPAGTAESASSYRKIIAAVEATRGLVLNYGGEFIQAVYHSTCGGMTAAAAEVWGRDFPYLQPVEDPYCSHSPYYRREVRMELSTFLAAMGMGMEDRAAIPVLAGHEPLLEVSRQGPSGRNVMLRLPPRTQERSLSGNDFRRLLGLPSTHFHWKVEGNQIIFYTQGHGHGVGLCQYGADGMGQEGKDFKEILEHYYRGVVVQPLSPPVF
ncbi:MAG: SpoIID/LytB domain-containing protein [Bacillota bacterium]